MKYYLTLLAFSIGVCKLCAQTNVSGGIYSNTTWTAANSPYIVVDTVAVFPGVTLTIEPGVEVKFEDNKRLEIRQARLVAVGTQTDSIFFTSNSQTPYSGVWAEVLFNDCQDTSTFTFCDFSFADKAILFDSHRRLEVSHSKFVNNNDGIYIEHNSGDGEANIENCEFLNNGNGIYGQLEGIVKLCSFYQNINGIKHTNGWEALIFKSLFNSNTEYGIDASGVDIDSCTISNNSVGFKGSGGVGGYISNTLVTGNVEIGLHIAGDSVVSCQITNNGVGIQNWGGPEFGNNDYDRILLLNNVIGENEIGIRLYPTNQGGSLSGPPPIYCNSICNNQTYGLEYLVEFGDNFIADNNYWCSQDSTIISSLIYDGYDNINLGLVDFVPFDDASCSPVLGIENAVPEQSVIFFPNPFTDMVYWNSNETISNVEIVDLSGRTIYSMTNPLKKGLNLDHLNSGFYVIRLLKGGEVLGSEKLLKL